MNHAVCKTAKIYKHRCTHRIFFSTANTNLNCTNLIVYQGEKPLQGFKTIKQDDGNQYDNQKAGYFL